MHSRKMKTIKALVNFRKINNLDLEDPRNCPNEKMVLTVVRGGEAGQQILGPWPASTMTLSKNYSNIV